MLVSKRVISFEGLINNSYLINSFKPKQNKIGRMTTSGMLKPKRFRPSANIDEVHRFAVDCRTNEANKYGSQTIYITIEFVSTTGNH